MRFVEDSSHPVELVLRVLGIASSTYYWWRRRVERVMRGAGLRGAFLRKRWRIGSTRTDPRAAPAPDLVERVFTADRPNRL
ncbi:hypothetical protein [Nocardia grenadensis]|uniref:hypothetical protein n=1 Tax=Nocardia grenadensis TaxID=931537 RepID=UPI003D754B57